MTVTVHDELVAQYRYFTTDLLTGEILNEVSFEGVSWERQVIKPGAFAGTITPLADEGSHVSHLSLYETTMPGKCGVYVVRDNLCVWGGIIWNRSYDIVTKSFSVDALEFTSYLYHRVFWKTMALPQSGTDLWDIVRDIFTYLDEDQASITDAVSANAAPQGSMAAYASINITVDSGLGNSGVTVGTGAVYNRGSSLRYAGEWLENMATVGVKDTGGTTHKFEYYVECEYNASTSTFDNVFKAFLVQSDVLNPDGSNTKALGDLYGPSGNTLPAGYLIFEHPGNIDKLTMEESSDGASTRTWVADSGNDLGAGAARYYGSWANVPYMSGATWPLLETAHTDQDFYSGSNTAVQPYALRIGYRNSPPIGAFTVSVNGSLSPEVGSYAPGDWCVIRTDDKFVNARMQPPYENRSDYLVRKIQSFKVTVPNNPAFPEIVELFLVPSWEVGV